MDRCSRASSFAACFFLALAATIANPAQAAEVEWAPTDNWTQDSRSGRLPFKSGTIHVAVIGDGILTKGWVVNPFATVSANYENIDTQTHHVLEIRPSTPHTDWALEFDLRGTTLNRDDVFTAGQLAVASTGVRLTDLTVTLYAPDDRTVLAAKSLTVEQHALISPNFDARLDWNPDAGTLRPVDEGISKNSGWAFFKPGPIEVGKIVVSANATGGPDAVNFSFGTSRGLAATTAPHLTLSPASGRFLSSQVFDLALLLESTSSPVAGGRALFDGSDVTPVLADCLRSGSLRPEGAFYRCGGLRAEELGTGPHLLEVEIELEDGQQLRDAVRWDIVATEER